MSKEDIKLEEILEKLEIANNELKAEEKIAKFIDEKEQKEIEE